MNIPLGQLLEVSNTSDTFLVHGFGLILGDTSRGRNRKLQVKTASMQVSTVQHIFLNGHAARADKAKEEPIIDVRVTSADDKLHQVLRFGIRWVLLGFTPERYVNEPLIPSVVLWGWLVVFYGAFTTYELCNSFFFGRNLLEMIAHAYIATYVGSFFFQWGYFYRIIPKIYTGRVNLTDFHCTKNEPESTEEITEEYVTILRKVLTGAAIWLATNTSSHVFGPLVEALVTIIGGGTVEDVFILPHVLQYPMWVTIIAYVWNFFTTTGLFFYCVGSYAVIGSQVASIRILCETLNAALINAEDSQNISGYVRDHVKILKIARELNDQLVSLNYWVITSGYLEFATQMFVMTLFDLNLSYYIAVSFDMMSIFLLVSLQCFMQSEITESLRIVADGPYFSKWHETEKGLSTHVVLMTQMAQNTFPQRIWLGSLPIERSTTLDLLRSSYAAYTVLMIFQ